MHSGAAALDQVKADAAELASFIASTKRDTHPLLASLTDDSIKVGDLVKHSDETLNAKGIPFLSKGGLLPSMTTLINNTDREATRILKAGALTDELHGIAFDLHKKEHGILFPDPVKGFWPNVKQKLGYVYRPLFDGVNLYFELQHQLSGLPVRILQH